jgi:hypothetical protein
MKRCSTALAVMTFLLGLAAPAFAQYPASDLGGTWYFRGLPASIWQQGNQLTLLNERGTYSRGAVLGPATIIAYDWGPLRGSVTPSGQEIVWPDGATWARYQTGGGPLSVTFDQGVCATWYGCSITAYGDSLVLVNERGEQSDGYSAGPNRVYALAWRLGGTLVYQGPYLVRIEWDNGTWWGR